MTKNHTMNTLRLLLATFAAYLTILTAPLGAQEYQYSDDLETFKLQPFVVSSNDPDTYDYWGEFFNDIQHQLNHWATEQLSQGQAYLLNEIIQNTDDFSGMWFGQLRDSMDGQMNMGNGWGLLSPQNLAAYLAQNPAVAGYVLSNGQGGYMVIVDSGKLAAAAPNASWVALTVISNSVVVHETKHATDAIAANPTIFSALFQGWGLGTDAATKASSEISATNAQLAYLQDQLANNSQLSHDDKNEIQGFIDTNVIPYLNQFTGGGG